MGKVKVKSKSRSKNKKKEKITKLTVSTAVHKIVDHSYNALQSNALQLNLLEEILKKIETGKCGIL